MQVKAVLFDLFDTLLLVDGSEVWYTSALRKLHKFLVNNGVEVAFEDFSRVYFEVRDELYIKSEKNLEEPHFNVRVSEALRRLGYDLDVSDTIVAGATKAFGDEFTGYVRLDDDAPDILKNLCGKYKIGIVSNIVIPECAYELLNRFDLRRFFDVVVFSAEINKRKPSREIFAKALSALGLEASEAVFVGDTPSSDIDGARNAGIKAILIKKRTSGGAEEVSPDKVIRTLRELPHLLDDC